MIEKYAHNNAETERGMCLLAYADRGFSPKRFQETKIYTLSGPAHKFCYIGLYPLHVHSAYILLLVYSTIILLSAFALNSIFPPRGWIL